MWPDQTRRAAVRLVGLLLLAGTLTGCGKTAMEYLTESRTAPSIAEEERLLTLAVRKDPDLAEARLRRAWVYALQKKMDEALADYDALHQKALDDHARALSKLSEKERLVPQVRRRILSVQRRDVAIIERWRGRALELNSRYAEAIRSYTSALEHSPATIELYAERASAYFKFGRYPEAMEDYQTILDRHIGRTGDTGSERRGEWRLRRAYAAVCAGRWTAAAEDFQTALTLLRSGDTKTSAFIGLYLVACRIGNKTDADRELLARAQATYRRYADAERPHTWAYLALWHLADLINEDEFVAKSRARNKRLTARRMARAQYYIGARHLVNGANKNAGVSFQACVGAGEPSMFEYHLSKVEVERLRVGGKTAEEYVALAMKESDRAKRIILLTRALGANPNHVQARRSRGIIFSLAGDYKRAIDDFTRLLAVAGTPADRAAALRYRAFAHAASGDHETAVGDYGDALEADPKLWQAHEGLAGSLCALRRYDEAAAEYATLMEERKLTALGPFWRLEHAFALTCAGKWEPAAADFRALVATDESPIIHANLYLVEARLGKKADAAKRLKAYVAKSRPADWQHAAARFVAGELDAKVFLKLSEHSEKPVQQLRTSRAHYYIGAVHLAAGKKDLARAAFAESVQLGRAAGRESWEFRMALAELARQIDWR